MDFNPKKILFLVLTITLGIYVINQSWFFIFGPEIRLETPGEFVATTSLVTISGVVKNAAWLTLNDRQIFTDEKGVFEESLLVSSGVSIMRVKAKDRFGREKVKNIKIIFNG